MLVNRWGILQSPLQLNISHTKTKVLAQCICCLHNWLIYLREEDESFPLATDTDNFCSISEGEITCTINRLDNFLDSGAHFDDVSKIKNNLAQDVYLGKQY